MGAMSEPLPVPHNGCGCILDQVHARSMNSVLQYHLVAVSTSNEYRPSLLIEPRSLMSPLHPLSPNPQIPKSPNPQISEFPNSRIPEFPTVQISYTAAFQIYTVLNF